MTTNADIAMVMVMLLLLLRLLFLWLLLLLLLLLLSLLLLLRDLLFCLFVGRRFQAFVDDDRERDVVQIRRLNFQVTDELVFERVFGRSVEHLLLDVGLVGTKDDEGEFVAMSAFRRHVADVEASVATVAVLLDLLEVIPERSVVALVGRSVLASGVVEHLVDDYVFQVVTEFVNAVFVFSLLLHRFAH